MIQKLNQSIAFICSTCSAVTEKKLNIFDFSGKKTFDISCGDKKCKAYTGCISEYHEKYKLTLPCPFCGESHDYVLSKASFWDKDYLSLNCPATSFELFYLGTSENIRSGVMRQEKMFTEMEEDFASEVPVIYDILLRLQELQEDKLIVCSCGSDFILPEPVEEGIMLVCGKCGAKKLIPATEEEYDTLLDTEFIMLDKNV